MNMLSTNGLVMPSNYITVSDEEVEYVDGAWNWGTFWKVTAGTAGAALAAGFTVKEAVVLGGLYAADAVAANAVSIAAGSIVGGVISGMGA